MQQPHADLRLSGAVLAVASSANAQLSAPIATPTFADVEAHYDQFSSWQANTSPLLFFLCGPAFSRGFTFQVTSGPGMNFHGFVFVGTAVNAKSIYARVMYFVDAATLDVQRVVTIDSAGNRNTMRFTNATHVP
jgi:hypothetical protein